MNKIEPYSYQPILMKDQTETISLLFDNLQMSLFSYSLINEQLVLYPMSLSSVRCWNQKEVLESRSFAFLILKKGEDVNEGNYDLYLPSRLTQKIKSVSEDLFSFYLFTFSKVMPLTIKQKQIEMIQNRDYPILFDIYKKYLEDWYEIVRPNKKFLNFIS